MTLESLTSGTLAGTGSFRCELCGHVVTLATPDALPRCPDCEGATFTRASLFTSPRFRHGDEPDPERGERVAAARDAIDEPGRYLVFHDAVELRTVPLAGRSLRIGRSLSADLRFDDPTVSRRHALLVGGAEGVRVLDDRSLNGVFVNGERIDSRALEDGDEIVIGRYRLSFFEVTPAAAAAAAVLRAE